MWDCSSYIACNVCAYCANFAKEIGKYIVSDYASHEFPISGTHYLAVGLKNKKTKINKSQPNNRFYAILLGEILETSYEKIWST